MLHGTSCPRTTSGSPGWWLPPGSSKPLLRLTWHTQKLGRKSSSKSRRREICSLASGGLPPLSREHRKGTEPMAGALNRFSEIAPAVGWLRSYQRAWLGADLIAGLTLAAYLLPSGIGDASLAGLPAQA